MMIRRLIVCCLCLLFTMTLVAQENGVQDSLVRSLQLSAHDTTRLGTLLKLLKMNNYNPEQCDYYAAQLLAEAELQRNNYYKCEAYLAQIISAYNVYDVEKANAVMVKLEPLARKEKMYEHLFKGWRCTLDLQLLSQDFERNEKEIQKMLKEARKLNSTAGLLETYQCMANLYRLTFRKEEAAEVLEQALPLALENNKEGTVINIQQQLLFLYEDLTRNDKGTDSLWSYKWIATLNDFETYLEQTLSDEDKYQDPIFLILYASYIKYYVRRSDWEQTEKYRIKADTCYPLISSPLYKIYYDHACTTYYIYTEQYDQALSKIEKVLELRKQTDTTVSDYYETLLTKAIILYKTNRFSEALPLYKHVFSYRDSLQAVTINKQYERLKTDYTADQLFLRQSAVQHKVQVFMLILLGAGLFLIGYLIIYLLKSQKALRKAEHEMRGMTEKMEQANIAKDRFLSNIGTSIREPLHVVVENSLKLAAGTAMNTDEKQIISTSIRQMSGSLLKIINDILDLSRLEAGMMKFSVSDTEIVTLIQDAASAAGAAQKGVEVCTEIPENTFYMVRLDGTRLSQIFTTLLEEGAGGCHRITIQVREQNTEIQICITGTGLARKNPSQEIIIRNEINRMLVGHFGGQYVVSSENTLPEIRFSLQVVEIIRSGEAM